MEESDACQVEEEEGGLDDAEAHEGGGEVVEGDVVLEGVGGPPVVGEEVGVDLAERFDEVDGVVAAAELVAAEGEGEGDGEEEGGEVGARGGARGGRGILWECVHGREMVGARWECVPAGALLNGEGSIVTSSR